MQSLAITPTLHPLPSSGASAAPSCRFRTLSHAHTAFTPLSNSHAKHSTLKVNGHRRLQPSESNHSLARSFCFFQVNGHRRLQPSESNHSLARSFCFFQQYSSTERKGKPQQGTVSHATAIGETQVETDKTGGEELQITKRRQAFIVKVYAIVASQLAATAAVSSVLMFNPSLAQSIVATPGLLIALFLGGFFTLWRVDVYKKEYPLNFIALGAFTLMQSLAVGLCCAFTDGKVVLEALAASTVAVTSLTGYTFWAAKRGKDFGFLEPILFPPLVAIFIIGLINIFVYPVPGIDSIAYSAFGALLFCGYLVLSTDNLIKRYKYDEYIPAATGIYLDILNLFLRLMRILSKLKKSED